ncbi:MULTISPECIES: hypothetical protein [unclassified Legionella]|uniref:hypothetical protein n=1 Tax=unclassified Legionella TaxID=2622702 RepID=UPI0010550D3A|nr:MULTISPECIES: hypothetical protein [unclassified Legionella]MDI9819403.1 hypothetical protein [Legionella sp. PL877]
MPIKTKLSTIHQMALLVNSMENSFGLLARMLEVDEKELEISLSRYLKVEDKNQILINLCKRNEASFGKEYKWPLQTILLRRLTFSDVHHAFTGDKRVNKASTLLGVCPSSLTDQLKKYNLQANNLARMSIAEARAEFKGDYDKALKSRRNQSVNLARKPKSKSKVFSSPLHKISHPEKNPAAGVKRRKVVTEDLPPFPPIENFNSLYNFLDTLTSQDPASNSKIMQIKDTDGLCDFLDTLTSQKTASNIEQTKEPAKNQAFPSAWFQFFPPPSPISISEEEKTPTETNGPG